MRHRDHSHQRQADARAVIGLRVAGTELHERREQARQVGLRDADPLIRDGHLPELVINRTGADLHTATLVRELDRTANEGQQHLPQAHGVGDDRLDAFVDVAVDLDSPRHAVGSQNLDRLLQGVRNIDRLGREDHPSGLDLRVVQHMLDEAEQVLATGDDSTDVAGVLR